MSSNYARALRNRAANGETNDESTTEKKWNTVDFIGKYHLARFSNKETPIPGTQIKLEKEYEANRLQQHALLEKQANDNQKRIEHKIQIKDETRKLRTQIYFDTIIGQPIDQIEKLLNENEKLFNHDIQTKFGNYSQLDLKSIEKFFLNVKLNRFHYVGYSITNGYDFIDYQLPSNGNTALHVAVSLGHVETVEELLKFKIQTGLRNNFGYCPIHCAWHFWNKTKLNRSKEARLEQENKTFLIIEKILQFGGYIDILDLDRNSTLHYACQYGTTKIVKLLLSFQADFKILNKFYQSASDICNEYNQIESYRLINSWDNIRSSLVHLDFILVWHKFLLDYEAIISSSKPAATLLLELDMELNIGKLERSTIENLAIDDPMLKQAYKESVICQEQTEHIPKPWQTALWKDYKKSLENDGVEDLKSKLENLMKSKKKKKKRNKNEELVKSLNNLSRKAIQRAKLPENETPATRPRLLHLININNENDENSSEEDEEEEEEEKNHNLIKSNNEHKISAIKQRRLNLVHSVSNDAKFLNYTKRLTTNSALLIPLRTPFAPLEGTEEEKSVLRAITSQGPEFENLLKNKKKDKLKKFVMRIKPPSKSTIGAYNETTKFNELNDRDKLYQLLAIDSKLEELHSTQATEVNNDNGLKGSPKKTAEFEIQNKIELVNDKRPRYVSKSILPPIHTISKVETMSTQMKAQEEKALRKKQGLSSDAGLNLARQEIEAAIAASSSTELIDDNS
eukprot:gene7844-10651_t